MITAQQARTEATEAYNSELKDIVETLDAEIMSSVHQGYFDTDFEVPTRYAGDVTGMLMKEGYTVKEAGNTIKTVLTISW
jgi:restriction endonuclease